jgi:hypothetical protein
VCSQLAAGWDKPGVLCVAAPFHDIAKGRSGDHSVLRKESRTGGWWDVKFDWNMTPNCPVNYSNNCRERVKSARTG